MIFLLIFSSYLLSQEFQTFINQILIGKQDSTSALIRLYTVSTSFGYFLQYPILGIGWSMATSDDLVVLLLANSGILGFLSFFYLIYYLLKKSIQNLKKYIKIENEKKRAFFNLE